MELEEQERAYRQALSNGASDVAYCRVMLLGPAGVGKTSLKRGLMGLPFNPRTNSTIVADINSVRPGAGAEGARSLSRNWMTQNWCEVTEDDEITELAQLMKLARNIPDTSISISDQIPDHHSAHPSVRVRKLQQLMDSEVIQKAMSRAREMEDTHAHQLKCRPCYHLWDCGGQPVFLEVLPAFLTSRTMFLILFNAAESLHQQWESVRYMDGKKRVEGKVSLSTQELMERWISCIHHLLEEDEDGVPQEYPKVIPVGTRGDSAEKEIVLKELDESFKGKAFQQVLKMPIIIDNTTAGRGINMEDPGYPYLRGEIFEFTSTKLVKKTPIAWVLFRKYLQLIRESEDGNIITLSEAEAIGSLSNIAREDVPFVLQFYHELGVLLHYPHLTSLREKVILSPKWFVECLGKVLTLPVATEERYEYRLRNEWDLLQSKGILVQPLYTSVWGKCKGIEPEGLIELLTCFQLAVEVKTDYYHKKGVKQFFVPAVLPYCSSLHKSENPVITAAPLHITFHTGFVTPGFFTRLATTMVDEQNDPKLELYAEDGIYHDKITYKFKSAIPRFVTLTESSSVIKIDYSCYTSDHSAIEVKSDCVRLKGLALECCQQVENCLHIKTRSFKFEVVCQKCEGDGYHYLIDPDRQQSSGIVVSCREKQKSCRKILPEEAYWYSKQELMESETNMEAAEQSDYPKLNAEADNNKPSTVIVDDAYHLLKEKSVEWDAIGRELRVPFNYREELRREAMTSQSKLERVLARWAESHCSEVSWDTIIKMLEDLKFVDMAKDVIGYLLNDPDAISKYGLKK